MNYSPLSTRHLPQLKEPAFIEKKKVKTSRFNVENTENPASISDFYLCCTNCMFETGLLWSPYSFRCGAVMSIVVNIICVILSMIGIFIQFDVAAKIHEYTFDKIWSSIFGPAYKVFPNVLLLFSSI